jgi:hypothetical protein
MSGTVARVPRHVQSDRLRHRRSATGTDTAVRALQRGPCRGVCEVPHVGDLLRLREIKTERFFCEGSTRGG